ncbi:MAG TPA: hypothetical protein VME22_07190, partial [Solirubrobacteraceae bacterium]|nr:hypothetical protein [Solirubrobacteraceae bacterium]
MGPLQTSAVGPLQTAAPNPFAEKIDELVDRSRALVRADVVHGVLVAMGYHGSYRTTRRAVAEAK